MARAATCFCNYTASFFLPTKLSVSTVERVVPLISRWPALVGGSYVPTRTQTLAVLMIHFPSYVSRLATRTLFYDSYYQEAKLPSGNCYCIFPDLDMDSSRLLLCWSRLCYTAGKKVKKKYC